MLKSELVSRYYFQSGRAKAMLASDPFVLKAIEVLNGSSYTGILNGTVKPGN